MCLTFVFINERFLKQPSPFLPSTLYYVSVCSPIGKYPNLLSLTQKKISPYARDDTYFRKQVLRQVWW